MNLLLVSGTSAPISVRRLLAGPPERGRNPLSATCTGNDCACLLGVCVHDMYVCGTGLVVWSGFVYLALFALDQSMRWFVARFDFFAYHSMEPFLRVSSVTGTG